MSNLHRLIEARELSDADLRINAQGCTELTCIFHGPFNTVLRERGVR